MSVSYDNLRFLDRGFPICVNLPRYCFGRNNSRFSPAYRIHEIVLSQNPDVSGKARFNVYGMIIFDFPFQQSSGTDKVCTLGLFLALG